MPISGSYTWTETSDHVEFAIPLKGTSPKNVNIFIAETILKVSFPPFLVDLNLAYGIDDEANSNRALLQNGVLKIRLIKRDKKIWGELLFGGTQSEASERRQKAIVEREERLKSKHEQAKKTRREEERMTLRKQMALDQLERQHIAELKADEKKTAEEYIYRDFRNMEQKRGHSEKVGGSRLPPVKDEQIEQTLKNERILLEREPQISGISNDEGHHYLFSDSRPEESENFVGVTAVPEKIKEEHIFDEMSFTEINEREEEETQENFSEKNDFMPEPRQTMKVTFKHTPRLFKTPRRESTTRKEEDFIVRNRPYLRSNNLLNKDALDISESDPIWLKGKGDDFYRSGDFRSAINAYSCAFEADADMIQALSNRAACYLQLGETMCSISDCKDVLQRDAAIKFHFQGKQNEEIKFRQKVLVRMGTAKCFQGDYELALKDFKEAIELGTCDSSIHRGLERIETLNQASKLKKKADSLFGEGDLEKANQIYTQSLSVDATFISSLSNRAACFLAAGEPHKCIHDCDTALDLLSSQAHSQIGSDNTTIALLGSIPLKGSKTRRKWVITNLCRRGAARAQIQDLTGAISDLRTVSKLIRPDDLETAKAVARDIEVLEEKLNETAPVTP